MIAKSIRFLLVSRRTPIAAQLKRELEKNPAYTCMLEENSRSVVDFISHGAIDYLIFVFDYFGEVQAKLVDDIQGLGHVFQIFIIAGLVSEDCVKAVQTKNGVLVFKRETLDFGNDVHGLVKRIAKGQKAFPRKHKRFPAYQRATLENLNHPDRRYGVIIGNLSQSGAYIEYSGAKLGEGDAVRLIVEMSKLRKTRIVFGRVMWRLKIDNQLTAAGIKFEISQDSESSEAV